MDGNEKGMLRSEAKPPEPSMGSKLARPRADDTRTLESQPRSTVTPSLPGSLQEPIAIQGTEMNIVGSRI